MNRKVVSLIHRRVLSLRGNDTIAFLQNLLTNDMKRLIDGKIIYAMLLNPKGRIVQDLFLAKKGDEVLLECDSKENQSFCSLLKRYVMHKNVSIQPSNYNVYFMNSNNLETADPRVPSFGARIFSEKAPDGRSVDVSYYHSLRYEFGIPEGVDEMSNGFPLFRNVDLMNGISSSKGCYIGQERSAVAFSAGRVRQRTMPFTCNGIITGKVAKEDGEQVGEVLGCNGSRGVALIKLTSIIFPLQLSAKDGNLQIYIPNWWPQNPQRPYSPNS